MDFSLTEEQQLLKDSVDRFVRENYEFETRRKTAATSEGFTDDNWKQMAELGWLAVALPEEFGGIGGGATDELCFMQHLEDRGRASLLRAKQVVARPAGLAVTHRNPAARR